MAVYSLNDLLALTADDLEVLKTLGYAGGAATAEELALKLDKPGEDLTPQMDQLVKRHLLTARTTTVGNETFNVYLLDPMVQKKLKT